jgi:hypothetical protein
MRGHELWVGKSPGEYWKVKLTDHDGSVRWHKVHHLVAAAFHGERPSGLMALHRDDDKTNNSAGNLYYGTNSQNQADAIRNGTHKPGISLGEKHGQSKLKAADIPKILWMAERGKPLSRIAGYFGVTDMTIHDVVKGKTWRSVTGRSE